MGRPDGVEHNAANRTRANRVSDLMRVVLSHPIVLVGFGSAVGGVLRYYLGRWVDERLGATGFPWGTFIVNVSGSFVLGVIALLVLERLPPDYRWAYLLLGIGLCGGFTTFSTFEWETYQLVRDGSMWLALANVAGSVACGFAGILLAALTVYGVLGRPPA
jgi:fluoride exporter